MHMLLESSLNRLCKDRVSPVHDALHLLALLAVEGAHDVVLACNRPALQGKSIIDRDGRTDYPLKSKTEVAVDIVNRLAQILQK